MSEILFLHVSMTWLNVGPYLHFHMISLQLFVYLQFQFPLKTLIPDQKNIIWNSKEGFTIRSPSILDTGLFYCETTVNGVTHKQDFIVYRPGEDV